MHNNWKGVIKISSENPLKALREKLLISRSELARRTSLSVATLGRIEKGKSCRLDTKRKIVEALRFNPWLKDEKSSVPERQDWWRKDSPHGSTITPLTKRASSRVASESIWNCRTDASWPTIILWEFLDSANCHRPFNLLLYLKLKTSKRILR